MIPFESYLFEEVQDFIYLGSVITMDNDEAKDVRERIKAVNKAYLSLLPIMKSRNVYNNIKVMLYKTLIRSVVTYGGEAWSMTQQISNDLDAFERKILRRIYGPVQEGVWRIRYNHELYQLYKTPKLSEYVRFMRLRWAGHV